MLETVDSACVTNRFEYDALDRRVADIDGRNNRTVYAYDAKNNLVSTSDAIGSTTSYGYDLTGQTLAITNALGNVVNYDYDLRGNKTYEGGSTYPVRYTYDIFGNKMSMTTYRNEASGAGDTTTWAYDEASVVLLSKTYADGKGLTYTYTDDGNLATRTNARGIVTTYRTDDWGQLSSLTYSDETPSIAYTYDAMGRQTTTIDVARTTTFTYDAFGELLSEVSPLAMLTHSVDAFGRDVGYTHSSGTVAVNTYDALTGNLASTSFDGTPFAYTYAKGLPQKVSAPTFDKVLTYESSRDLITQIAYTNAVEIASRTYTYDALGSVMSRVQRCSEAVRNDAFSYNPRSELTAATLGADAYAYDFDDIGNRTTATAVGVNTAYTANSLNQYTAVGSFTPTFDADGNQTRIQTATGVWAVDYNAETRPVHWTQGTKVITMTFRDVISENPFRFSSEFHDDTLGLIYYNYRHYDVIRGYWLSRDSIEEEFCCTLYGFVRNRPIDSFDQIGLALRLVHETPYQDPETVASYPVHLKIPSNLTWIKFFFYSAEFKVTAFTALPLSLGAIQVEKGYCECKCSPVEYRFSATPGRCVKRKQLMRQEYQDDFCSTNTIVSYSYKDLGWMYTPPTLTQQSTYFDLYTIKVDPIPSFQGGGTLVGVNCRLPCMNSCARLSDPTPMVTIPNYNCGE